MTNKYKKEKLWLLVQLSVITAKGTSWFNFCFAVSRHCLPEAQTPGKWLVKRGLEEELIWLHTPGPACPQPAWEQHQAVVSTWEITKTFINRCLTCHSLPFHPPFLFQLRLQFHGGTDRKMRGEPSCLWTHSSPACCHGGAIVLTCVLLSLPGWSLACPCSNTPLCSTYLPRCHYLQPWLWLSPQWDIHTNPTTTVPTELDFNWCQQQVSGAGWLSITTSWFFQTTQKRCLLHDMRKGQDKRDLYANTLPPW